MSANKDFVTPAEEIVQPEAYRKIADEYFKDLKSEYPGGKISTLSKPLYEKGEKNTISRSICGKQYV